MRLAFALFTYFPHGGLTRDLIAIARTCRQLFDKTPPFEKIAQRLGVHSKVRFLNGRDDVPEFLLSACIAVRLIRP